MDETAKNTAALICKLIDEYDSGGNPAVLKILLAVFMHAQVSVPMQISMEDADVEKFLHAQKGDTITTDGMIRMKPDMLRNSGGELFFPAFTQIEEAEEGYRNSFSWITMDFMNCAHSAYHNENCAGVVINGFSKPFVVSRPLLKLMIDAETSERKKENTNGR